MTFIQISARLADGTYKTREILVSRIIERESTGANSELTRLTTEAQQFGSPVTSGEIVINETLDSFRTRCANITNDTAVMKLDGSKTTQATSVNSNANPN